ncbi:MAG: hypothetical protein A2X86_10805 [Bdellovibrionales bacterium GWA2_49_15]|nr:MAG: hypothetical protein A2X86_10805 [Bdellovibrionales bacterium GWA2_49_15]
MLNIVDIGKKYDSQIVLHGIDLKIQEGEFFGLLGQSGCGKSTLLRIIAGLESPSKGAIFLDNTRIDTLRPQDRPFNMVFQRYALFPHLSVFANVAFGPSLHRIDKSSLAARTEEALKLVGLWDYRDRLPETLSGGQQQRVALARAVINRPKMLLLDEPLSALDKKMRESMREELRNLQRKVGITFIFVTHDQEEALALSDRVAVMNHGRLEQVSAPEELYHNPETLFVAQFVGDSAPLTGATCSIAGRKNEVAMTLAQNNIIRGIGKIQERQQGIAIIRPEKVRLTQLNLEGPINPEENTISGKIQSTTFRGSQTEVQVEVAPGQSIKVFIQDQKNARPMSLGELVQLSFSVQDTFIFPPGLTT